MKYRIVNNGYRSIVERKYYWFWREAYSLLIPRLETGWRASASPSDIQSKDLELIVRFNNDVYQYTKGGKDWRESIRDLSKEFVEENEYNKSLYEKLQEEY